MNKKTIVGIIFSIIVVPLCLSLIIKNSAISKEMDVVWQSDKEMFDFLSNLDLNDKYKNEKKIIATNSLKITLNDNKNNNLFLENSLTRFISKEGIELISSLGSIEIESKRNFETFKNISHTNGDANYCKILLGYKPLEAWNAGYNPQKKLFFSLTHELSHCLLGKEIFKKGIEWDLLLEKQVNNKINEYLLSQSNKSWVLSQKGTKVSNPLVVYHETFADIFTILYLYEKKILDKNNIEQIFEKRKAHCQEEVFCYYKSYFAKEDIGNILEIMQNKKLNIEELFYFSNIISQKIILKSLE